MISSQHWVRCPAVALVILLPGETLRTPRKKTKCELRAPRERHCERRERHCELPGTTLRTPGETLRTPRGRHYVWDRGGENTKSVKGVASDCVACLARPWAIPWVKRFGGQQMHSFSFKLHDLEPSHLLAREWCMRYEHFYLQWIEFGKPLSWISMIVRRIVTPRNFVPFWRR